MYRSKLIKEWKTISPLSAKPRPPLFTKEGSLTGFMEKKGIHNNKKLLGLRRKLRASLTPAEAFLWKYLKAKQLDKRKFVKQHSIGSYIVDFYCPAEKLIIELDGEVHADPQAQAYDIKRTEYLGTLGFKVIRFENKMVFDHLEAVLQEIKDSFKN